MVDHFGVFFSAESVCGMASFLGAWVMVRVLAVRFDRWWGKGDDGKMKNGKMKEVGGELDRADSTLLEYGWSEGLLILVRVLRGGWRRRLRGGG